MVKSKLLKKVLTSDANTIREMSKYLGEVVTLVDDIGKLHDRFLALSMPILEHLDQYQKAAIEGLIKSLRYQLVAGALAVLRGHNADSASYTRKAIELTLFIFEAFTKPKSALIWFEGGTGDPKKYDDYIEEFKIWKLLTKRYEEALGPVLRKAYDDLCLSVHPSVVSAVQQTSFGETVSFRYSEVDTHQDKIRSLLVFFGVLDVSVHILHQIGLQFSQHKAFDTPTWKEELKKFADKAVPIREQWLPEVNKLKTEPDAVAAR